MDYDRICNQEGYRLEDLAPEDRRSMKEINFIIEQMQEIKESVIDNCVGELTDSKLFNTMLEQFADGFFDEFMVQLVTLAQELQIWFAERNAMQSEE